MRKPATGWKTTLLAIGFLTATQAFAQVKVRLAVGVVLPLSGPMGSFGGEVMRGIEFAMAELKEKDADLASRIEINAEDSQSQSKVAETLARKMVATRKADILLGGMTSSVAYGLAKISNELQKPLLLATATHPGLTAVGPYVFRSCSPDDTQGRALAKYAFQTLKKQAAGLIFEKNSSYAKNIAQSFENAWIGLGGKIAVKKEYEDAGKFREMVRQVSKAGAEVLLAPMNYPDAAKLIEAVREEGAKFKLLGTDSWDSPNLWTLAKTSAMKGHFFATQFSPKDTGADAVAFVGAFKAKYRVEPTVLAAQGYDAMQVVYDVLRRSKSNLSSALTKAFAATVNVPGSSGPISIDAIRMTKRSWQIMATGPSFAEYVSRVAADE